MVYCLEKNNVRKRIVVAVVLAFLLTASTYGQTSSFFELVKTGTSQSVQAAIKQGAEVNAQDNYGRTPLMHAATFSRNPEVITVLVKAGANVNARDNYGWTALMLAASGNQRLWGDFRSCAGRSRPQRTRQIRSNLADVGGLGKRGIRE